MISPKKDDVVTITATPRPTLVFLGVASDPSMEDRATDQEKQVGEMLRAVSTLNVICVGHSASQPILRRSGLSLNSFLSLDRTRTDEERRTFQEGLAKLCASLKAEMVCVGALYREKIQENLFLNFAAPPASAAESFYVDPNQGGLKGILAALNRPYSMYRSWIGVRTVDLVGRTAPVVLAVAPEGPAAAAGILPGMEVVEVAGKPVPTSAALLAAIDSTHPGDPIHLKVRDPRKDVQPRPLDLTTAASPVDVPAPIKGALVYSRLIAELSVAAKTVGGGLPHFLLAQCFLDLNDPASAFNEIQNATLGGSWGICDGTVFYYKGRILGQLGFRKEAGDAFRQALAFPRATLYDTDGRLVVDAAQRALRDLAP